MGIIRRSIHFFLLKIGRPAPGDEIANTRKPDKPAYEMISFGNRFINANAAGRIVTAGGTTSWHDLALPIISRHCSPGEALRIAQVYLLKWHGEGQLPYATLVRRNPHADSVVRSCEDWLTEHFRDGNAIAQLVTRAKIPERTLKRRFRAATGATLIEYLQNLRVEEAKRLLEAGPTAVDEISVRAGYEDPSFFRRLFKRRTGLTPSQYRRMFQPVLKASEPGS